MPLVGIARKIVVESGFMRVHADLSVSRMFCFGCCWLFNILCGRDHTRGRERVQISVASGSLVIMSLTAFVENYTVKYYYYNNTEHLSPAVKEADLDSRLWKIREALFSSRALTGLPRW